MSRINREYKNINIPRFLATLSIAIKLLIVLL